MHHSWIFVHDIDLHIDWILIFVYAALSEQVTLEKRF